MEPYSHIEDYGWIDDKPSYSCAYLSPPILKIVADLPGNRVLDLGCGNGALCRELKQKGFDVVGCDVDQGGLEIGRKCNDGIPYHALGVYDDPTALGKSDFDIVICTEVVEHLFEPREMPRFARALLRDGGHLIVSTPYHGYLKNLALAIFDKWDHHHHPLEDGGHVKFWSRKTLSKLLEVEGFRVTKFLGAGRLPFLWNSMIIVGQKNLSA